MEIERKFTVKELPSNLEDYPFHKISQAYLCENPVVRIRKEDDKYYMTYKGRGMMAREEANLSLNREAYEHLLTKADGNIISKTRYLIPVESVPNSGLIVELDVFDAPFEGLIIAEVEFPDTDSANAYTPESWFDKDVTSDRRYHNSNLVYGNISID